MASTKGFEPLTARLEGVCSIQLSYEDSNDMKFMKRAFYPPRTLMTGILGGGRSIHLSYGNGYVLPTIICKTYTSIITYITKKSKGFLFDFQ